MPSSVSPAGTIVHSTAAPAASAKHRERHTASALPERPAYRADDRRHDRRKPRVAGGAARGEHDEIFQHVLSP
jgi:hypothetical protein